ncbi:class I SAM-dependent methyltransferase [Luteolibacter algae]|uniref:Class I SAM-dependent methyltransferase n=1 Tax=Luteolibacter algae TaxID=454151 RepID=A0ABW5D901_9BACT
MSLRLEEIQYPVMSHPSADPWVNAKVARAAGLDVPDLSRGRILEIGCGTGHHILSVANRWPQAKCTGLDISPSLISRARNLARQAGFRNVRLCENSITQFEPDEQYDCIIAHGVFSWVEDEVKLGLMDFLAKYLSPSGIAVVSFNVVAGWRERMPIVEKAKVIQAAGDVGVVDALELLKSVTEKESELEIIGDMLAKGGNVLAHDDFADVMDLWSLGAFVNLAKEKGLGWLGDSVNGDRGDDDRDKEEKKTFRSEILYRADAVLGDPIVILEDGAKEVVIPDFPRLDAWRLLCVREALPVVDAAMKPCVFTFPQLRVMAAMDGSLSVVRLAEHAAKCSPELDFVPWLRHVAERGLLV